MTYVLPILLLLLVELFGLFELVVLVLSLGARLATRRRFQLNG